MLAGPCVPRSGRWRAGTGDSWPPLSGTILSARAPQVSTCCCTSAQQKRRMKKRAATALHPSGQHSVRPAHPSAQGRESRWIRAGCSRSSLEKTSGDGDSKAPGGSQAPKGFSKAGAAPMSPTPFLQEERRTNRKKQVQFLSHHSHW